MKRRVDGCGRNINFIILFCLTTGRSYCCRRRNFTSIGSSKRTRGGSGNQINNKDCGVFNTAATNTSAGATQQPNNSSVSKKKGNWGLKFNCAKLRSTKSNGSADTSNNHPITNITVPVISAVTINSMQSESAEKVISTSYFFKNSVIML